MNKRMLLVAAAVLLALVGTFAVYSYGHNADQRAAAGTRSTTVLIVSKRVPAGTSWADVVKGGYLSSQKLPSDSAPSSALASTTSAAIGQDAVAAADLAPGTILLRESFGTRTAQTGVLSIPKGLIAVSVLLASNQDVAGFVAPESQVIVFTSAKLKTSDKKLASNTGDDLMITTTVLPRALVIAVSQSAPTSVSGAKDASSTSTSSVLVTLALSQRDVQRLILAQKTGELYLGLLSSSSVVDPSDPGVVNAGSFEPAPITSVK